MQYGDCVSAISYETRKGSMLDFAKLNVLAVMLHQFFTPEKLKGQSYWGEEYFLRRNLKKAGNYSL
jgi:hypothetical protein